jgi:hypothetical protein
MVKKNISQPILKDCTAQRVWTSLVGSEKLGPQAGHAEIFMSGGIGQKRQICDFDGRTEPQN